MGGDQSPLEFKFAGFCDVAQFLGWWRLGQFAICAICPCCRAAGHHNGVCVRGMRRRYNDGNEDDEHKEEEDVS